MAEPITEIVSCDAALRAGDAAGNRRRRRRAGRCRLDAIARWLQDVAYADVIDAGFEGRGAWIVRRTANPGRILPPLRRELTRADVLQRHRPLLGRAAHLDSGAAAPPWRPVALWVCLDPERGRPHALPARFLEVYEESAAGRDANVRLRHPEPPDGRRALALAFPGRGDGSGRSHQQLALLDAAGGGAGDRPRARGDRRRDRVPGPGDARARPW